MDILQYLSTATLTIPAQHCQVQRLCKYIASCAFTLNIGQEHKMWLTQNANIADVELISDDIFFASCFIQSSQGENLANGITPSMYLPHPSTLILCCAYWRQREDQGQPTYQTRDRAIGCYANLNETTQRTSPWMINYWQNRWCRLK